MKITSVESLHADAGWRNLDFLKISTDEGIVGWSEYNESFGGPGVSAVIRELAPALVGKDPRAWEAHVALMYALRHFSAAAPNLRIMEIDPDMVPWQGDLVTVKPQIKDGHLSVPTGPGWGTELNEEAVRAHPPALGAVAAGGSGQRGGLGPDLHRPRIMIHLT